MIKANELRMGNIVYAGLAYDDDGENERPMASLVLQVFQDGIWWTNDLNQIGIEKGYNHTGLTYVNPIPLTEEWLIKFGFEKADNEGQPYFSTIKVDIAKGNSSEGYRLITEDQHEGSIYWLGNPFYYVHQLQNLFHALTGEELTSTS